MENQSVKNDLIAWITNLKDEGVLQSLVWLKQSEVSKDWADDLSSEARKSIEKGIEDSKNDRVISREEFWKRHGR